MQIQQKIAFEKTSAQIGRALEVMVEGSLPEDGVYITRTYMDAPEVDGYVFVATDWNLMSGDFLNVKITGADEYDLIGEDVLITGAGPIGMMAAGICKHNGARNVVITDVNEYRLELARKMGASFRTSSRRTSAF